MLGQTTSWKTGCHSAQEVELQADPAAIQKVSDQRFNLYSHSQYIVRALQVIETVPFIGTSNSNVQSLFRAIQKELQQTTEKMLFWPYLSSH